jgi:hypothetical protein
VLSELNGGASAPAAAPVAINDKKKTFNGVEGRFPIDGIMGGRLPASHDVRSPYS